MASANTCKLGAKHGLDLNEPSIDSFIGVGLAEAARQSDRVVECLLGVAIMRCGLGRSRRVIHCGVGRLSLHLEVDQSFLVSHGRVGCHPDSHTVFAISRSLNFWILPVLVFGSSANTT